MTQRDTGRDAPRPHDPLVSGLVNDLFEMGPSLRLLGQVGLDEDARNQLAEQLAKALRPRLGALEMLAVLTMRYANEVGLACRSPRTGEDADGHESWCSDCVACALRRAIAGLPGAATALVEDGRGSGDLADVYAEEFGVYLRREQGSNAVQLLNGPCPACGIVHRHEGERCPPLPRQADVDDLDPGDWAEDAPSPDGEPLAGGAALIAAERRRQILEEGQTPEHDDWHLNGELAAAAVAYAAHGLHRRAPGDRPDTTWPEGWRFNPSRDPIRNFVKAGALLAAEVDRLQRAADGGPAPEEER